MLLVQVPGGDVLVGQVLPATPADSVGIVAGDVVTRIGTLDTRNAGLDSLRRHFRQPGRTDTLVLDRESRVLTVVLHQRELP